jgi:hypothetical protein
MNEPFKITFGIQPADTAATFSAFAAQYPGMVRNAFGRAGAALRARLRQAVAAGGGLWGVPAWRLHQSLTVMLSSVHPLGGKLAKPESIQMFQAGSEIRIGWMTWTTPYASAFQAEQHKALDNFEKHWMHVILGARGFSQNFVSNSYDRTARPAIDPFAKNQQDLVPAWIMGALEKQMKLKLSKGGM